MLTALFALCTWKLYPTSSGTVVFVKKLWYEVSVFITEKILFNFILHFENVVFGYFIQDNVNNEAFVINLFILLVKFHIHKCKFSNRNPVSQCFIKNWKAIFVPFKVALIERLSKLSVCVLSSKYLSNVKVMHVCLFFFVFFFIFFIFIYFILFPWLYIVCVLFCICCLRHNKKKKKKKKNVFKRIDSQDFPVVWLLPSRVEEIAYLL